MIIGLLFALVGIICGFALGWMTLSARVARQSGYNASLKERLTAQTSELDAARRELTETRERIVSVEAEKRSLEKQQAQLQTEFKNIATAVLNENSKHFSTHTADKLGVILNPLRDRIGEFQKLVSDSFATQRTEQNSLKGEIEKIVLQADGLTKALRGDVKAQGNWGEVVLERILEESGLRKDIDYIVQGVDMKLIAADGSRQQPDVVIRLPEDKHIIVDSKVSLTAYERYCGENNEAARDAHLKEFLKSVRAHVNGLSEKSYHSNEKLRTPDMVLMFMPIEGAFSLALQQDRELHAYAWGRNIAITCPTTLFVTLKTIASMWRIELQNQNAQEIARQGGALYDKFTLFVKDLQAIGKNITGMQQNYDAAMNKLTDGRGNLVTGVEKLKQLGAKATKPMPQLAGAPEADEEEEAKAIAS